MSALTISTKWDLKYQGRPIVRLLHNTCVTGFSLKCLKPKYSSQNCKDRRDGLENDIGRQLRASLACAVRSARRAIVSHLRLVSFKLISFPMLSASSA